MYRALLIIFTIFNNAFAGLLASDINPSSANADLLALVGMVLTILVLLYNFRKINNLL